MGPRLLAVLCAAAFPLAAAAHASAAPRADVAALQVALRAVGAYGGTVDGVAGTATSRAVTVFQRRRGLLADGIAGARTRRALGRRGRPAWAARVIGPGDRGWDVAALQFLLARRGFPSGPFDGGFGERTRAALRRFQRWAGLPADGIAGAATRAALRRAPRRSPIALGRPVAGPVGDRFGPRGNRFHTGVDFPVATGTPVVAAHHGVVRFAGWHAGGYGRLVVLAHPSGVTTWHAHLSSIAVGPGASVAPGGLLGRAGASGRASGPHLHWEVRLRDAALDPLLDP